MRKFLVKNFVLDYFINVFGKTLSAPRASRIIYPLFVFTGFLHTFYQSTTSWVFVGLTFLSLYFGFVHFSYLFPVKWEELDDLQKYQYGGIKGGDLTKEQFEEWLKIVEKTKLELEKK